CALARVAQLVAHAGEDDGRPHHPRGLVDGEESTRDGGRRTLEALEHDETALDLLAEDAPPELLDDRRHGGGVVAAAGEHAENTRRELDHRDTGRGVARGVADERLLAAADEALDEQHP